MSNTTLCFNGHLKSMKQRLGLDERDKHIHLLPLLQPHPPPSEELQGNARFISVYAVNMAGL